MMHLARVGRFPLPVVALGENYQVILTFVIYGNDLALPVDEESLYTTFGLPR